MNDSDLLKYKEIYLQAVYQNIEKLRSGLHILIFDPANKEAIEIVYHAAHSLKSENLAMGYEQTGFFCKILENLFYKTKQDGPLSKETLGAIIKMVDRLEHSIECIKANNAESIVPFDIQKLEEATGTKIAE